jgi:transcriptional regulator with PAS, ATPase and Fis domain
MTLDSLPALNFEGLFQNSSDPLFAVNAQRRLIFFNHACESLTGVPAERVLGLECRHHGPHEPSDPVSLVGSLCPPLSAFQGEPTTRPALLLHAQGERLWRVIHFTPISSANGELAAILGRIGPPQETEAPSMTRDDSLHATLLRLRQRLYARFRIDHVVAASPAMRRVLQQVRLAADSHVQVFIEGERGTGKERLARLIHTLSATAGRPFVTIDCEVLTPELLQQQLSEEGLLESRAWATLYLREPGLLPAELQGRLIRFLENQPASTSQRVLAGSTKPLTQLRSEGACRHELLDLLSTLVIAAPSLRDRRQDIPILAQQVLEECNAEGPHQIPALHPGAREVLLAYPWPGNVVQLEGIIREAHGRAAGPELTADDLPRVLREAAGLARVPPVRNRQPLPLDELLATAERRIIQLALRDAGNNLTQAAARLGISRPRLHRRLAVLGLIKSKTADNGAEIEPDVETRVDPGI